MSSYQPLISVIMPCYNAEQFLPMALDSIINQTYTNLEIVCINDGSTDETADILEGYAKKDKRIRVIHNETNLKLIATLNKGIALAKGDYIARMDADDVSYLNRIEKLFDELIKNDVDIVSCISEKIDMSGTRFSSNFLKAVKPAEVQLGSYFFTPIGHALLVGRKDVFIDNPYSNNDNALHSEDYELWTRMIRNKVKLMSLNEVLYSYRINDESVSRKHESIQKENFIKSAQIHQEKLLKKELDIKYVCVAVNRMDQPTFKEFKSGINLINEIYLTFIKQQSFDKHEKKSFRLILAMHKTDIFLQILKKGHFLSRCYGGLSLFIILGNHYFNGYYRKFIKLKFKKGQ